MALANRVFVRDQLVVWATPGRRRAVNTFIENGGRIKFDLIGLEQGVEGATTWELRQILGSKRWEKATDFFGNGQELTGAAREEALRPWR